MTLKLIALAKTRNIKVSLGNHSIIAENADQIIQAIDKILKLAKLHIIQLKDIQASYQKGASIISCRLVIITKKILEL